MDDTEDPRTSGRADRSTLSQPTFHRVRGQARRFLNAPAAWIALAEAVCTFEVSPDLSQLSDSWEGWPELDSARSLCRQVMSTDVPLVVPDPRIVSRLAVPDARDHDLGGISWRSAERPGWWHGGSVLGRRQDPQGLGRSGDPGHDGTGGVD